MDSTTIAMLNQYNFWYFVNPLATRVDRTRYMKKTLMPTSKIRKHTFSPRSQMLLAFIHPSLTSIFAGVQMMMTVVLRRKMMANTLILSCRDRAWSKRSSDTRLTRICAWQCISMAHIRIIPMKSQTLGCDGQAVCPVHQPTMECAMVVDQSTHTKMRYVVNLLRWRHLVAVWLTALQKAKQVTARKNPSRTSETAMSCSLGCGPLYHGGNPDQGGSGSDDMNYKGDARGARRLFCYRRLSSL